MTTTSPTPAAAATPRLDVLDILRGFALFGILVVNLPFFAQPIYLLGGAEYAAAWPDRIAAGIVAFAFEAKFYVLFAFLFGYGLSVQLARASAHGAALGPRYGRRLLGLLMFGALHAVLLFVGDILVSYVLLGALLWLMRAWQPRTLLLFAAGMLALAVVARILLGLDTSLNDPQATVQLTQLADDARRNYGGTFASAVQQRLQDLVVFYVFTPLFNWPTMLAMFALGLAAGKRALFADLRRFWALARRALPWALPVGIGGNLLYVFLSNTAGTPGLLAFALVIEALAAPALTFCYVAGVIWLTQRPALSRWLAPLRYAGRMSLTNYLGQALICSVLFNGWGLGFYGQIGPLGCLLLAPAIYVPQLALSALWLRFFRYGPDEWLLRSWTYLRWMPLRAAANTSS